LRVGGWQQFVLDDYKPVGFKGDFALFDAKFLSHCKVLDLSARRLYE
jgi:hypothetical protein